MINLLILTNELNYTDGVTSHLYYFLTGLNKKKEINIFVMCSGGDSIEKFKNSGIQVFEDKNLNHKYRSIKHFSKAIINVLKFSRKNKINIIHTHNHYAANIAKRASKFSDAKTIQTIHGLIPEGGRLNHFIADKYVGVSEPVVNHLLKNKIASKENIKLIRHGFPNVTDFTKESTDEIKIICASRLVNEKGIDNFIKAAAIVKDRCGSKAKFFIAGTGEAESELKSLCKTLNIKITFLGKVKDIIEVLKETNIFVSSTRSQSEGFPMSIVEAAFTKNLIIVPEFDWLGNIFKNKIDGLTFKIDNHEELSERIMFALDNPEKANQMAESFRSKVQKLFNIQTMLNKHLELYNECLTA